MFKTLIMNFSCFYRKVNSNKLVHGMKWTIQVLIFLSVKSHGQVVAHKFQLIKGNRAKLYSELDLFPQSTQS